MKLTFIGNPNDPSDNKGSVIINGVTFPLNLAVEVDDVKFARLAKNSHFRVGGDAVVETAVPESPDLDKAALTAQAEALGITVDGRWSAKKIADFIAAHGAE